MSFSEYSGSKTKVSQTVGRIFKNAQGSFPKIQTSQAVGAFLKSISTSGSNNEHERLNKSNSPVALSSSKFGFQKFRLRTGLEKKKTSNHRAELLDNQEIGEESADETDMHQEYPPLSHTALIEPPSSSSISTQKQKKWPF